MATLRYHYSVDGDARVKTLAITGLLHGLVDVHDQPTGQHVYLVGHNDTVVHCAFSLNGARIVTISTDNTARIWDTAGKCLHTLLMTKVQQSKCTNGGCTNGGRAYRRVAFSDGGSRVVTCGCDLTACVWDANTGGLVCSASNVSGCVTHCRFSPGGMYIITGYADGRISIWNAASGDPYIFMQCHQTPINDCSFSTRGDVVTVSNDMMVKVWDIAHIDKCDTFSKHVQPVNCCAFSVDGSLLATGSADGMVHIWLVKTGDCIQTLLHGHGLAFCRFSLDGGRLVTATENGCYQTWIVDGT